MALLSVIRRWHVREGMPIREITRRTGLSRNTVRKYLACGVVEPSYPKRKSFSKLDNYEHTLTSWLFRESKRHRKLRRNIRELHRDLMQLGYTGSYDRVAAFARPWREQQRDTNPTAGKRTYVPLAFAPGEAFQFDWSEDFVVINGCRIELQIAHFKLSYSRAFFLRAYPMQSHEMLFDAHLHAFSVFGGVPERGIYDNMKTAVDKIGRGKARSVNQRFQAMLSHYLFEADFCSPAAGWEKGQVEKSVRDSRHRVWHDAPPFESLDALNGWLQQRCLALWQVLPHPEDKTRTIQEYWQVELEHLMPTPVAFDGFVEHTKRVTSTCLIAFEHNRYSVPASFANRIISLRVYANHLVIVTEAQVIASHPRHFTRNYQTGSGKTVYDWRHYLSVLQRKPDALRNGAPFKEFPESFRKLQTILLQRPGDDREVVEVLSLVLMYDEQLVERAVASALEVGLVSKQHVLNCLGRLSDTPKPEPLQSVLSLVREPIADTQRYERLRGGEL